jgi:hypothetical protein
MDFAAIATGFLALIGPYVTAEATKALATAAGKKVAETGALDLYNSVKGLFGFRPEGKQAVEHFERSAPGSSDVLAKQLSEFLLKNPDICDAMRRIVQQNCEHVAPADQGASNVNIGKITQGAHGTITSIGSAGPVTIDNSRR